MEATPHIGCQKQSCANFYKGKNKRKSVISLGLVDVKNQQKWLFEATPELQAQLAELENYHLKTAKIIDGVFLTHTHIGHYTGLIYFGRETYGKKDIVLNAMPKMMDFLTNNGPWNQLITLQNIKLQALQNDTTLVLNENLKVTPFLVPHRDEFSETVGYTIKRQNKSCFVYS
tara:strand:+ start:23119 stop:23637 length:519 start_codon:yes stop_codon:yes gene_type:complete